VTRIVSERLSSGNATVKLSFGVATLGRDGLTLDELTRAADRALYAAKRGPGGDELARRRTG
jgi:GGDEF domain-containing protein